MPMTPEEHERAMLEKYNKSMQNTMGGQKTSSIVCPKHVGQPCKVCDLVYSYYVAKLGKDHYLRQRAHDLNRKMRYYSNIIMPSNPTQVILFEYGDLIYKMLFGFFNDPKSEYRGFTDPVHGRNLVIKKTIPQGNKRLTDYFIEMKVQPTPLMDMSVCGRLHNLDKVSELIESGAVKPLYQSQLPEDRTEIRVLPSWLGPKYTVFYAEVPYHYLSKEEFEAIQSGKVNPFAECGIGVSKKIIVAAPTPVPVPVLTPEPPAAINPNNPWAEIMQANPTAPQMPPFTQPPTVPPTEPQQLTPQPSTQLQQPHTAAVDPICMGSFAANSPLCTHRCAAMGFMEKCQKLTANGPQLTDADQKVIRETAARLYK